jgi:aminopeptidase N
MKKAAFKNIFLIPVLFFFITFSSCRQADQEKYYEEGVSKFLAVYRNSTIKNVTYNLRLAIPEGKDNPIDGNVSVEFTLNSKRQPLLLDFRVPDDYLKSVSVNGREMAPAIADGHIIIPGKYLSKRYNVVSVGFRAGDMSLNRNDDYLYTLFVPDRASTAFPCFDQPDLKARFSLTLDIPSGYRAMSNSPVSATDTADGRVTIHFADTKPISTYLFAFVAGKFELVEKEIDGMHMEMLHRETRPGYIENNADAIFRLHANALKWLAQYTQIDYPFDKFGFVLIPSFQYSGMEHPGSIYYRASSLLLDESPTLNEKLSRASLIAHETSHIWFGDLVTMKWFDDVWLKEVFAGFMSDKIVNPDFPEVNHDLRFYLSRYPAAYEVDRTEGTNPIIQKLDNMKDAGSLYGAIIYNKAPVVMRLLEKLTGDENLRKSLQIYLKEYAWGNARWDDLVAIIEKVSHEPLEEWSRMWVREAGMPVITPQITNTEKYRISFSEEDPAGTLRHWPQTLETMVIAGNDTMKKELRPADKGSYIEVSSAPECIIPDVSGMAYGTFIFDSLTTEYLETHINAFSDPLVRGILWVNLNENLVNGKIKPADFYSTAFISVATEPDIQLRNYIAGRFSSAFWNYLSDDERKVFAPEAEKMIGEKIISAADPSEQRTWYNLYRNIALTDKGLKNLESIWKSGKLPGGLKLSEDDLCTLSLTLALKGQDNAVKIIAEQRKRITGNDRLLRFDFVTPSVSSDQAVRDAFFNSLRDPVNREHEPWVLEALGYLHHPLVAQRSEKYILPSLDMLEEIKRTGDIFFPGSWISITLAGHHSAEAKTTVEKFLDDHPGYPADLRLKILQAADHLMRTNKQTDK